MCTYISESSYPFIELNDTNAKFYLSFGTKRNLCNRMGVELETELDNKPEDVNIIELKDEAIAAFYKSNDNKSLHLVVAVNNNMLRYSLPIELVTKDEPFDTFKFESIATFNDVENCFK